MLPCENLLFSPHGERNLQTAESWLFRARGTSWLSCSTIVTYEQTHPFEAGRGQQPSHKQSQDSFVKQVMLYCFLSAKGKEDLSTNSGFYHKHMSKHPPNNFLYIS